MTKVIVSVVIFFTLLFFVKLGYKIYKENPYYKSGHRVIAEKHGDYELIWGNFYGGPITSKGYCIFGEIDSLKSLKWNDRMIVVEQNIDKENRWAVIIPQSAQNTLLDRIHDTLIRDLTEYQIDSIIKYFKADNFTVEELKPDIIERCYK